MNRSPSILSALSEVSHHRWKKITLSWTLEGGGGEKGKVYVNYANCRAWGKIIFQFASHLLVGRCLKSLLSNGAKDQSRIFLQVLDIYRINYSYCPDQCLFPSIDFHILMNAINIVHHFIWVKVLVWQVVARFFMKYFQGWLCHVFQNIISWWIKDFMLSLFKMESLNATIITL